MRSRSGTEKLIDRPCHGPVRTPGHCLRALPWQDREALPQAGSEAPASTESNLNHVTPRPLVPAPVLDRKRTSLT